MIIQFDYFSSNRSVAAIDDKDPSHDSVTVSDEKSIRKSVEPSTTHTHAH